MAPTPAFMMKKTLVPISGLLLLAAGLVTLSAAPPAVRAADMKVGTVDMNKIFQSYYKTKDAETKINEQLAAFQSEFNSRQESYRKSLEEIRDMDKKLEDKALSQAKKDDLNKQREGKIQENQQMGRELESFQRTRARQIDEQRARERNRIVEEIMDVVKKKVGGENYDLVFDKGGLSFSQVPVVLYSRDNMEFSEEIIRTLNKNKPADTPAPAAAATPGGGATPAPPAAPADPRRKP